MLTFYFDNAATTKIKPEVLNEMMPYLTEEYGNPSSLYSIGRSAKRAVERARTQVANLINANRNEIYFTGCGTESDNTALKGIAYGYKDKGNHIITSKIEHNAILESCKMLEKSGFKITYLNVNKDGIINLQELENSITKNTILISIMFANNEIGSIQPIKQIAKIAKQNNIVLHTDAVQAVGNVPIDVEELGIDMLSMSGHKINAPKGIGALYVRNGIEFEKFMNGGHQEKNKRAGTENLAGIVGLGKACELARTNLRYHIEYIKRLRDYYHLLVLNNINNVKINGSMESRLPGNSNISFLGVDSTALLLELDKKGICCSAGSACNSGEAVPSHVLTAIGLDSEISKSALRVTFGDNNSKEEVEYLVENIKKSVQKLR
ncbi:MAG: cysteine desulfurase NifS [Clostridia bacterium]|nr:cysteine desulfurase NifS [Clostridia bacterium]